MNIEEYSDILNLEIGLTYYPNQGGRWAASFNDVEVKDEAHSAVLRSEWGDGITPSSALLKYIEIIKGRRLVVDATGENRREYEVPVSLTLD